MVSRVTGKPKGLFFGTIPKTTGDSVVSTNSTQRLGVWFEEPLGKWAGLSSSHSRNQSGGPTVLGHTPKNITHAKNIVGEMNETALGKPIVVCN